MSVDQQEVYTELSGSQQLLLAILPIPSSICSVLGSSVIIFMALKSLRSKAWTPYNRLLLGMSVCDIIFSITLGLSIVLLPNESSSSSYSKRLFAFGNDASCNAMGFLIQFSYSAILYNAMLSFYFLLTARFGFKNDQIAKRIEPVMHAICVGFPTATAWAGLFMDAYSESGMAQVCWVKEYPKGCGYYGDTGEQCKSTMLAWVFGGSLNIFVLFSLIVNNFVIWVFVRGQIKRRRRLVTPKKESKNKTNELTPEKALDVKEKNSQNDDGNEKESEAQSSIASSFRTTFQGIEHQQQGKVETDPHHKSAPSMHHHQDSRLRLVSTQAFLFVGSYLICNIWTMGLRVFESQAQSYIDEVEMPSRHFPLLLIQAWFYPFQGVFNALVYIRPKYLKCRKEFPNESRKWAFRRAILGPSVTPLFVSPEDDGGAQQHLAVYSNDKDSIQVTITENEKQKETLNHGEEGVIATTTATTTGASITKRLPRDMVSSLTASQGDFIEGEDLTKQRWGGGGGGEQQQQQDDNSPWKKLKSLETMKSSMLSSIESSGASLEIISEIDELDPETLEEGGAPRWCATEERSSSSSSNQLSSDCTPTRPKRITDSPIKLPKRRVSLV